jgi:hypothetical protein
MIQRVEVAARALKQLRRVPKHIVDNLMIWVAAVEPMGSKRFGRYRAITTSR